MMIHLLVLVLDLLQAGQVYGHGRQEEEIFAPKEEEEQQQHDHHQHDQEQEHKNRIFLLTLLLTLPTLLWIFTSMYFIVQKQYQPLLFHLHQSMKHIISKSINNKKKNNEKKQSASSSTSVSVSIHVAFLIHVILGLGILCMAPYLIYLLIIHIPTPTTPVVPTVPTTIPYYYESTMTSIHYSILAIIAIVLIVMNISILWMLPYPLEEEEEEENVKEEEKENSIVTSTTTTTSSSPHFSSSSSSSPLSKKHHHQQPKIYKLYNVSSEREMTRAISLILAPCLQFATMAFTPLGILVSLFVSTLTSTTTVTSTTSTTSNFIKFVMNILDYCFIGRIPLTIVSIFIYLWTIAMCTFELLQVLTVVINGRRRTKKDENQNTYFPPWEQQWWGRYGVKELLSYSKQQQQQLQPKLSKLVKAFCTKDIIIDGRASDEKIIIWISFLIGGILSVIMECGMLYEWTTSPTSTLNNTTTTTTTMKLSTLEEFYIISLLYQTIIMSGGFFAQSQLSFELQALVTTLETTTTTIASSSSSSNTISTLNTSTTIKKKNNDLQLQLRKRCSKLETIIVIDVIVTQVIPILLLIIGPYWTGYMSLSSSSSSTSFTMTTWEFQKHWFLWNFPTTPTSTISSHTHSSL